MVIVLNGTSSSGKSTTAAALRKLANEQYFLFSSDDFLVSSMPLKINFDIEKDFQTVLNFYDGFNRALKIFAERLDHIILDHVIGDSQTLKAVATALYGCDTFFVGLKTPIEILKAREEKRPNRKPGTAEAQVEFISELTYDLCIDTSKYAANLVAQQILNGLRKGSALRSYND